MGLDDALRRNNIQYSEIRMAPLQRSYEWVDGNWSAFVEDAIRELERVYPFEPTYKGPFIGIFIVTEKDQGKRPGGQEFPYVCELVDGQQRVTTTFLVSSILRAHLSQQISFIKSAESESNDSESIERSVIERAKFEAQVTKIDEFLWADPVEKTKPRLKTWEFLQPLVDRTVYQPNSHLLSEGILASEKRSQAKVFAAAVAGLRALFADKLSEVGERIAQQQDQHVNHEWEIALGKAHFVSEFFKVITQRMFVVKLSTTNEQDAAEVFLSLNSKGKPLATRDILKATLMDIATTADPQSGNQKFKTKWSQMSQLVDTGKPQAIDQYLRLVWVTDSKQKAQEKAIASLISNFLKDDPLVKGNILSKKIFNWATVYDGMIHPSATNPNSPTADQWAISQLRAINWIQSSYRFFLLPYLIKRSEKVVVNGEVEKVIEQLHTLSYTWKSVFDLPQALEDFFTDLGRDLMNNKSRTTVLAEFSTKVNESIDKMSLDSLNQKTSQLLLHTLEEACRRKKLEDSIGWGDNSDSVEHVIPQTSTPKWLSDLALEGVSNLKYIDLVQRPGNLTLLNRKQNSGIKQKPWIDPTDTVNPKKSKRAAFKDSAFFTTRDLENIPLWSVDLVKKRGLWVSEMLSKIRRTDGGSHSSFVDFSVWNLNN